MSEKPIIFSSEMVRAILEGRKTQTRRVIKPQPTMVYDGWEWPIPGKYVPHSLGGRFKHARSYVWWRYDMPRPIGWLYPYCPYGNRAGDRLWVRESFGYTTDTGHLLYRADIDNCGVKWKSPRFMSRNESRLTIEVVRVRVERVQDIREADAKAEGVQPYNPGRSVAERALMEAGRLLYKPSFSYLWDSINDKRGFGWDVNPWVWVIEFKLLEAQ